ncbi:MAG: hypothetical protein IPJ97_00810 [Proteobacteria bacterium]|nr:hypothetical protein [Pseudomonadota bacterium]
MVDDPAAWAENGTASVPADIKTKYAYKASVMQDTHQSHAMEFAYPQSMANCVTCHKEQAMIDRITADEKFVATTCKSCHPVDGVNAKTDEPYEQPKRAPAMAQLWVEAGVDSFHDIGLACGDCHVSGGVASQFTDYHSGYDTRIYDASNQRYTSIAANQVAITSVTRTGDTIDIKFTAGNTAIVPTLTVSFYGYNTKNMLVSSHTRRRRGGLQRQRLSLRDHGRRQPGLDRPDQPPLHCPAGQRSGCLARDGEPGGLRSRRTPVSTPSRT